MGQVLALSTAQVIATYMLTLALLLRSNLALEMSSALTEALGAPALDPAFVERWFDTVFLYCVASLSVGRLVYRVWGFFVAEEGDSGTLWEEEMTERPV